MASGSKNFIKRIIRMRNKNQTASARDVPGSIFGHESVGKCFQTHGHSEGRCGT